MWTLDVVVRTLKMSLDFICLFVCLFLQVKGVILCSYHGPVLRLIMLGFN